MLPRLVIRRTGERSGELDPLDDREEMSREYRPGVPIASLSSSEYGSPPSNLLSDKDRSHLSPRAYSDLKPKNSRGDRDGLSGCETERDDPFLASGNEDDFHRTRVEIWGGGRSGTNLAAGFKVLTCPLAIELIEALR